MRALTNTDAQKETFVKLVGSTLYPIVHVCVCICTLKYLYCFDFLYVYHGALALLIVRVRKQSAAWLTASLHSASKILLQRAIKLSIVWKSVKVRSKEEISRLLPGSFSTALFRFLLDLICHQSFVVCFEAYKPSSVRNFV